MKLRQSSIWSVTLSSKNPYLATVFECCFIRWDECLHSRTFSMDFWETTNHRATINTSIEELLKSYYILMHQMPLDWIGSSILTTRVIHSALCHIQATPRKSPLWSIFYIASCWVDTSCQSRPMQTLAPPLLFQNHRKEGHLVYKPCNSNILKSSRTSHL